MRLSLTAFQECGDNGAVSRPALMSRLIDELELRRDEGVPYPKDTPTIVTLAVCKPTETQRRQALQSILGRCRGEVGKVMAARQQTRLKWKYAYHATASRGMAVRCEWDVARWVPRTFFQAILSDNHEGWVPLNKPEATLAQPGSAAKVEILRKRLERGEELWHKDDAHQFQDKTAHRSNSGLIFPTPSSEGSYLDEI